MMKESKLMKKSKGYPKKSYNRITNDIRLKLKRSIMDEGESINDAAVKLNIKYSTAKSLVQIMKKKGTILRYFKERPKRVFRILKECAQGKMCAKPHFKGAKILLQKVNINGETIYNFRNAVLRQQPKKSLDESARNNYLKKNEGEEIDYQKLFCENASTCGSTTVPIVFNQSIYQNGNFHAQNQSFGDWNLNRPVDNDLITLLQLQKLQQLQSQSQSLIFDQGQNNYNPFNNITNSLYQPPLILNENQALLQLVERMKADYFNNYVIAQNYFNSIKQTFQFLPEQADFQGPGFS